MWITDVWRYTVISKKKTECCHQNYTDSYWYKNNYQHEQQVWKEQQQQQQKDRIKLTEMEVTPLWRETDSEGGKETVYFKRLVRLKVHSHLKKKKKKKREHVEILDLLLDVSISLPACLPLSVRAAVCPSVCQSVPSTVCLPICQILFAT